MRFVVRSVLHFVTVCKLFFPEKKNKTKVKKLNVQLFESRVDKIMIK